MPSLEKPCLLLPHGCERSTVYVCIPVDASLGSSSPVVETLMEFEGLVELPEGVSLDDFERWSAIATREPSTLTLDELSFALQVGDKLSAHNTTKLAKLLAAQLKGPCWTSSQHKESLLRTLLPLSKNMQQLVFRQLGTMSAPALFKWPMPLQQAYADQWASPRFRSQEVSFNIKLGHTPASVLSFLELLSRTDPSLPGLTSLSIECDVPTAEAASLCSSALLHHPRLAHLDMPRLSWAPCDPSPPAAAVLRTLPQLTAITALILAAPCQPPSPPTTAASEAACETVHAMAAAISALPSLARFVLHCTPSPPQHSATAQSTAPPCKRRKIAACMSPGGSATNPVTLDPVISALSTAPALASLTFCVPMAGSSTPLQVPCSGVRGPFPMLRILGYEIGNSAQGAEQPNSVQSIPASLLRVNPLPALRQLSYADKSSCPSSNALRAFIATASALTGVRHIDVIFGHNPIENRRLHAPVPLYSDLAPKSWNIVILTCAPAHVAEVPTHGLAESTCSHTVSIVWHQKSTVQVVESSVGIMPLLQPLRSITQLRDLELAWDEGCSHPRVKELCSELFAMPLTELTQLSALCLFMPKTRLLPAAELAEHLRTLTQLLALSLFGLEYSEPDDVKACLAPLTSLTYLAVAVRPVTAAVVRTFARCLAAMPSIRDSMLESWDGPQFNKTAVCERYASQDWIQGVLELPDRGYHQFACVNKSISDDEYDAVLDQLYERGAAELGADLDYVDFTPESEEDAPVDASGASAGASAAAAGAGPDAGEGDDAGADAVPVTGVGCDDGAVAAAGAWPGAGEGVDAGADAGLGSGAGGTGDSDAADGSAGGIGDDSAAAAGAGPSAGEGGNAAADAGPGSRG